jgi:hypothetical protein
MTENLVPDPKPLPAVEPRPWARRLAAGAAAVALSLGGAAVLGAAAVRLQTETVAVADRGPDGSASGAGGRIEQGSRGAGPGAAAPRFEAATVVVVRIRADRDVV